MNKKKGLNAKSFELNAPWTALAPVASWRHYRITKRWKLSEVWLLELTSVCSRDQKISIPLTELKEDANWRPGWL
jgi:tryptophan-rich hypothetical protein